MAISLNYHHLYYFFAVAKSGSIAKAAAELSLTPPTLSSQLKQFQRAVKHKLFRRDGNALKLTPEGRMFFQYARQMFALGDQLEDHIRDNGSPHAAIQIGAPHGTPTAYTAALVNHILRCDEHARIEVEEGTMDKLTPKMGDLRLDLLLTCERVNRLQGVYCENTLVGEVPIVFAMRAVNGNGNAHLLNPKRTRFIVPRSPESTSALIHNFLDKFDHKEVCEVPDREVALSLALQGRGCAVVDWISFSAHHSARKLRLARVDKRPAILENIFLASSPRKLVNPLAENAIRHFRFRSPAAVN